MPGFVGLQKRVPAFPHSSPIVGAAHGTRQSTGAEESEVFETLGAMLPPRGNICKNTPNNCKGTAGVVHWGSRPQEEGGGYYVHVVSGPLGERTLCRAGRGFLTWA